MNILDAARLMEACYNRTPHGDPGDLFYDVDLVQVHYKAKYKTLVIEGTNEPEDWFIYNFNLFVGNQPKQGDSSAWYHAGSSITPRWCTALPKACVTRLSL